MVGSGKHDRRVTRSSGWFVCMGMTNHTARLIRTVNAHQLLFAWFAVAMLVTVLVVGTVDSLNVGGFLQLSYGVPTFGGW